MSGRSQDKRPLGWAVTLLLLFVLFNSDIFLKGMYPFDYQEEIIFYGERYGVDPLLVAAIIRVESKYNERACSPRGARGLMQVMPDTGEWVAEQIGLDKFQPDLLYQPEINIMIGTWYLSSLQGEFSSNPNLVIAAYNGGRGRVNRWIQEGIWDGSIEKVSQVPLPETRNYVERVLLNYVRYQRIYKELPG